MSDRDVRAAAALLVQMVEERANGMEAFVTSVSSGEFGAAQVEMLRQYDERTKAQNAQWAKLAERLNRRYDQ